jgi:hypothetical protein
VVSMLAVIPPKCRPRATFVKRANARPNCPEMDATAGSAIRWVDNPRVTFFLDVAGGVHSRHISFPSPCSSMVDRGCRSPRTSERMCVTSCAMLRCRDYAGALSAS